MPNKKKADRKAAQVEKARKAKPPKKNKKQKADKTVGKADKADKVAKAVADWPEKDRHHAYLNAIGIKSTESCIFASHEDDDERQPRFDRERASHSFDSRETWSLDYTLATWLYEHLMMYQDIACIDLEFWKFDVKVPKTGKGGKPKTNKEGRIKCRKKTVTEGEAIRIACECIRKSLTSEWDDDLRDEYLRVALRIVAEILPALWW